MRITKAMVKREVRALKLEIKRLEYQVENLSPSTCRRHALRMNSILGAGVVKELRDAKGNLAKVTKWVHSIGKEAAA